MNFIEIERLLKVTPAKVLVPDSLEAVAYPSVLQVEPAESKEVEELTPKNAVSALSFAAMPVSRSDVLIGGGVLGNRGLPSHASIACGMANAAWGGRLISVYALEAPPAAICS